MNHPRRLVAPVIMAVLLAGCGSTTDTTSAGGGGESSTSTATDTGTTTDTGTSTGTTTITPGGTHEEASDYTWDESDVVEITLASSSISLSANAAGRAAVAGTTVTITAGGPYRITGAISDGQVVVASTDAAAVKLILSGASITTTSTSAPIDVEDAEKVVVILAQGTDNTLTDDDSYALPVDADEPNAALYSKANLSIHGDGDGSGTLTVNGHYNDGIGAKDGLVIRDARITVHATADDGIRGKDYLVAWDSTLDVTSAGDAMKSDNEDDAALGFIEIHGGSTTLTSAGDGINAVTNLGIDGAGTFKITTGGGSSAVLGGDASAKGLKSGAALTVSSGTFTLDTADDAVHSNGTITIDNGTFTISSGDDGLHADTGLTINGGTIDISKSYEGLESTVITLNGGTVHLKASDDGINVAGGNDGSGNGPPPGGGGNSTYFLYVNGGYYYVDAAGDGLDANGSIVMTGGTVIVNGPTANDNGALDYDGTFSISGGYLLAVGSSGMAQAPSSSSTQRSLKLTYGSGGGGPGGPGGPGGATLAAGTMIHIQAADGADLLTFEPAKAYGSVVLSAPTLTSGLSCSVYTGGGSTGTATDGLYSGGAYSGGTLETTLNLNSIVTSVSFN